MLEDFRKYIQHYYPLTDKEWEELSSTFKISKYKKGEFVYDHNIDRQHIYFIIDGLIRSYKIEDNGKDYTWAFHCFDLRAVEFRMLIDIMVVDYASFIKDKPEELIFEVMKDATLIKIKKNELNELFDSSLRWQKFARFLAEDAYAILRRRTLNLLTKTAKERLEILLNYFPKTFEFNIPHEYIASYLGMTRQTLIRVKKEIDEETNSTTSAY